MVNTEALRNGLKQWYKSFNEKKTVCTAFSSFPKSCLVKCHEENNKITDRAKFL